METARYLIDVAALAGPDLPLAGWYGEPMTMAQAEALARTAQQGLRRRPVPGALPPLPCRLQWLISGFWRGREVGAEADNLAAVAPDERTRALVELIHGQLLASVRRHGALARLDAGFALAAHLLSPEEYFLVLKRHEGLRALPWHGRPASPQGLESLLREAGVIRRLRGQQGDRPRGTEGRYLDTLG